MGVRGGLVEFVLVDCAFDVRVAACVRFSSDLVVKPLYEYQHFFRYSTEFRSVTHVSCFTWRQRGVGSFETLGLGGSLSRKRRVASAL